MLKANEHKVVAVFADQEHARRAYVALRAAGFTDDQLRWMNDDVAGVEAEAVQLQQTGFRGGLYGTLIGAGVGALLGALIGGVLLTSPAGALLGCLIGVCAGAALGVFAGPFIAMEADPAAQELQEPHSSRSVIVVEATERMSEAETILRRHGAYDDSMRAG